MTALKFLARPLMVLASFGCFALGALALANHFARDQEAVGALLDRILASLIETSGLGLPVDLPTIMYPVLENAFVVWGLVPLGLALLVAAVRPRRRAASKKRDDSQEADPATTVYVDSKQQKKAQKQAASLAKSGRHAEAAEISFSSGLLEEAATQFIAAEEFERAAEIRHDQNRFIESAELYLKAEKFESAGSVFAQQNDFKRSGEAYAQAGNLSVAGEMFEKAGAHLRAADAFAACDFPRQAATAYIKCDQWEKAAACLEEVIREEGRNVAGDAQKAAELRKLVMMAGGLYERADLADRAQAVLTQGGCFVSAAQIAMRIGQEEEAAELFLKAKDVPRAAEVMRKLGRNEEAARHLAEYHRDRGEEEQAAKCFEEAGELLSAGDLYRLLEQYNRAGEVYERFGDASQAAEMYALAGDRSRAAASYEEAGLYSEAAECEALAGNDQREADLLVKAGAFLRAAEIHRAAERKDEAIEALQQVGPDHTDFPAASAMLGQIFRDRGMLPLAIRKLRHATTNQDVTRENVDAFYTLATCMEENDEPAEAAELYEKILTFDLQYQDVADRLERTRTQAEGRGLGSETPLSGSGASGRYEITGKLGRGGMGIVYKARDTVLDRTVAFKVLPTTLKDNPQALKNFLREAKSAAALNHPNIVTVFDAGEQDGQYYIAMEYVDGNTLKEIVKHRGQVSAAGIVHVLAQLCEALAYAHDQKIVHRDIKTANAMWTRDRKAKIMDFGLAKVIEEVRNHTTVVSGTPYYMSPEQTLGKNIDHRTDIYSLGVSIFEMATGTLPFTEGNLPYHHVHTPPPDPRELNQQIPELLAGIMLRCMEKDPDDRYQSAREILEELRSGLADGLSRLA